MESEKINIGDLVKIEDPVAPYQSGVRYGTVINLRSGEGDGGPGAKVMMYSAGLGQYTVWLHISHVERVSPLSRL